MATDKKRKKKYPELRALWITVFCDILGYFIIIPLIPSFITLYKTTPIMIGLLIATNALFTFIFSPIWGHASDKLGRKPMLIICQSGTTAAFLILAFSNSLEMLFLSRIVDGVFGGNFTLVKAIISDRIPPKDRGIQMANVGVVVVLAGLIGPGLGGLLSIYGIIGPGLGSAIISVLTIILTIILLEESWPKSKRIEKVKDIKEKIKLRNDKTALYLLSLWGFHTLTFMMYLITMALVMALVLGLNAFEIGVILTIAGIFRAIIRFTLFKPTLRFLGEPRAIKFGLLILVITFFLIGIVRDVIGIIIVMLIFSYGASCSRGPLIAKITLSVSPKEMGKINGYTSSLDSFGGIIGPLIVGFIIGIYGAFWLSMLMTALALVALIMNQKEIKPFSYRIQKKENNIESISKEGLKSIE
ncbi:MAG: MFS transporter [Promethearchaeota archaeon]